MGTVYKAFDPLLARVVAVKVISNQLDSQPEQRERFFREARAAAQLSHPNIVPIYSVDESAGVVYFVMACVDGVNLARRLHDQGRLPVADTRRILKEVAEALAYAHSRGVIHRDIKPDNILLESDTGRAMVTDFGIARAVQEGGDAARLTATGVAIGTPAFMSPEQAAGDREIDGRSDLYSLGVVAYQMLTGELPFSAGSTASMLMKHLTERAIPVDQKRPEVPPDLSAIVMTLLEKEPERRFPSASALVLMIETASTAPYTPPARPVGSANVPAPVASRPLATASERTAPVTAPYAVYTPTPDDVARWTAPPVEEFRKKFIFYAAVNSVVLIAAIFTGIGLTPITVFWSMYMAYKYAGLWTTGYDWRDVFRQPRSRSLIDVASDTVDEARGIFDKQHRIKRRNTRELALPGPSVPSGRALPSPGTPSGVALSAIPEAALGRYSATVRQAEQDRNELNRLVAELSPADRKSVGDVLPSADSLYRRVQSLAITAAELDRQADTGDAIREVETQIKQLEDEANPFERARSEERVRRLALLKRQRRTLVGIGQKREAAQAKLESCTLALQNMRFDLVRLRAGGITVDHLTTVTERARALAQEVDAVVHAADEVRSAVRSGARRT
ncbi:MAG TPA: protein kinase, partial [Gemmatimonadaceae bacterium]|nr:protein kinase [Gemmatimonadaceae bacterium]